MTENNTVPAPEQPSDLPWLQPIMSEEQILNNRISRIKSDLAPEAEDCPECDGRGQGCDECYGTGRIEFEYSGNANQDIRFLLDQLQAYSDWAKDVKSLTRELDVALFGAGAAEQASLCDLIRPAKKMAEELEQLRGKDTARCGKPPVGWWCSRAAGHEGPCAVREVEEG